jgi:NAD(P)-dependent dehydrogenase (short-subunit alcohol dehydrogenase family)
MGDDFDDRSLQMDLELTGRVAVVTGASKGIGLAVTETLLREGAHVVATSRRRTPELDALTGDLVHVAADLMDPDAPAAVIDRALQAFGGLDVLVNNAGGPPPGARLPRFGFLELTDRGWQDMLEFNLLSAVRACRAAIPVLIERGGGAIVNISSGHGRQPSAINVDYGAAKAAMMNLTKALSEEFAPQGIRVNGVCPGPVRTPWWTDEGGAADILAARTGTDRDNVISRVAPELMQLATGRLAEPQEIADAVVLLASPRSGSTTGTELVVDSGWIKAM